MNQVRSPCFLRTLIQVDRRWPDLPTVWCSLSLTLNGAGLSTYIECLGLGPWFLLKLTLCWDLDTCAKMTLNESLQWRQITKIVWKYDPINYSPFVYDPSLVYENISCFALGVLGWPVPAENLEDIGPYKIHSCSHLKKFQRTPTKKMWFPVFLIRWASTGYKWSYNPYKWSFNPTSNW